MVMMFIQLKKDLADLTTTPVLAKLHNILGV